MPIEIEESDLPGWALNPLWEGLPLPPDYTDKEGGAAYIGLVRTPRQSKPKVVKDAAWWRAYYAKNRERIRAQRRVKSDGEGQTNRKKSKAVRVDSDPLKSCA